MKKKLTFIIHLLFSFYSFAQVEDELIILSKEDSLDIVILNDHSKGYGIFGKDTIHFNRMLCRLDSLYKEEQRFREEINSIENRSSKAALVHNYAMRFDSNYSKAMSFISDNIKISSLFPLQSLDYLMQKQAQKNKFQNDCNTNQLLSVFYNSKRLEDCSFFYDENSNFDNNFLLQLVTASKNISQQIVIKYTYLKHNKVNNIIQEKIDCHIANLKLILEEMRRMKYITDY